MTEPLMTMILLAGAHFIADYPMQGDFLSKAKNHTAPIPGVPWWQAMIAHAYIHAMFVLLITGSALLLVAEFIAHFLIDRAKCAGWLTYNQDQYAHILCKGIWVIWIWAGVA